MKNLTLIFFLVVSTTINSQDYSFIPDSLKLISMEELYKKPPPTSLDLVYYEDGTKTTLNEVLPLIYKQQLKPNMYVDKNGVYTALVVVKTGTYKQKINTKSLDSLISSWEIPNAPGGYLAVFDEGKQIYSKGFGMANMKEQVPFSDQTIFPVASISKHFTAICVLKLVENGQLDLNQSIVEFFPELSNYASEVTVADLLNHTSGIESWTGAAVMRGQRIHEFKTPPIEWLAQHGHLAFPAGTKYAYGNTSFFLAGEIVAKVSGKSLAQFATDEFFSKLGMKNTFYLDDPTKTIPNKAQGYVLNAQNEYIKRKSLARYMGPVGVYTTISDFQIWDNALRNNLILTPELLNLLRTSYQLHNGSKTGYGYGQWVFEKNGIKIENHGGTDYDWGYQCFFERYPEHNLTVIFFKNRSDLDRSECLLSIRNSLFDGQLSSRLNNNIKPKKTNTKKVKNLSMYQGTYYSVSIDAYYNLKITSDNELELTAGDTDPIILSWDNKETAHAEPYYIQGMRLSYHTPTLRFEINGNEVLGFELDAVSVHKIPFKKIK